MGIVRAVHDRLTPESHGAEASNGAGAGKPETTLVAELEFANRRLASLAHAIREHEGSVPGPIMPSRPHDRRLYKRLRDICGERIPR